MWPVLSITCCVWCCTLAARGAHTHSHKKVRFGNELRVGKSGRNNMVEVVVIEDYKLERCRLMNSPHKPFSCCSRSVFLIRMLICETPEMNQDTSGAPRWGKLQVTGALLVFWGWRAASNPVGIQTVSLMKNVFPPIASNQNTAFSHPGGGTPSLQSCTDGFFSMNNEQFLISDISAVITARPPATCMYEKDKPLRWSLTKRKNTLSQALTYIHTTSVDIFSF